MDEPVMPTPKLLPKAPTPARRVRSRTSFDPRFHETVVKSLFSSGVAGQGVSSDLHGLWSSSVGLGLRNVDTETLVDPMVQEPWFAAGVNLLVGSVSKIPFSLYDRDPRDPDAKLLPDDHPVVRLFANVGPLLSPMLLRKHDAINISLTGESFWMLKDENGDPVYTAGAIGDAYIDLPAEITPVRGDLVQPVRDRDTQQIIGWRMPSAKAGKGFVEWPAGAVVQHMELPDHRRPGRGLARGAQVWGSAAMAFLARRYNDVWLGNLGDPGGIVTTDGYLDEVQYARFQAQLDERWNDPSRAGETRLLEGSAQYTPSNVARPRDMAFDVLLDKIKDEITAVTGVPQAMIGMDTSNYATFQGLYRTFLFLRVDQFDMAIANALNTNFFPRLRDPSFQGIRVKFDRTELNKAMGDSREQGDGAGALTRAGVPPNRAQEIAGIGVDADDLEDAGNRQFITKAMVPMTEHVQVEAGRVLEQAGKALSSLTGARVPDEVAVRLVSERMQIDGLSALDEPEPIPELPAPGEAPAAGEEDDDGEERLVEPVTKQVVVARAAPSRAAMTKLWNRWDRAVAGPRRRLRNALRAIFFRMRADQMGVLADFAKDGTIPSKGLELPEVSIPDALLQQFERAWEGDLVEERALRDLDPGRLVEQRFDCQGVAYEVELDNTPRQRALLQRHPRLREIGTLRLRAMALLARANVGEGEIDRLIVVATDRWRDAIAEAAFEESQDAWMAGHAFTGKEVGLGIVDAVPPEVLEGLAKRSVKVAHDTTGQLAARLKVRIADALANNPNAVGSLQQQIEAALKEVNAATTRAFNSHRARAQAIALTETASAADNARGDSYLQAHEQGTVSVLRWVTSGRGPAPEGTVRPSHFRIEADAEAVVPGKTFSNGLRWPHDEKATDAGEVVRCQCTSIAETTE